MRIRPPSVWPAYRSLQGSGFHAMEADPNPFRRALELVRRVERGLVRGWLMSDRPRTIDVGSELTGLMARLELRSAAATDLLYLGLLLVANGWLDVVKPLFRECLTRYLEGAVPSAGSDAGGVIPRLVATLNPTARSDPGPVRTGGAVQPRHLARPVDQRIGHPPRGGGGHTAGKGVPAPGASWLRPERW